MEAKEELLLIAIKYNEAKKRNNIKLMKYYKDLYEHKKALLRDDLNE